MDGKKEIRKRPETREAGDNNGERNLLECVIPSDSLMNVIK